MKEKWIAFRQRWESEEELLSTGPSKSEYFSLTIIYAFLYLASGLIHEIGHVVGALLSETPIITFVFTPTVFAVNVNSFGKSLTFARLLGGLFQGAFFLPLSRRYRFMYLVTFSCFVYAVAEAIGFQTLMMLCAFISEIVGNLIVIYLAY